MVRPVFDRVRPTGKHAGPFRRGVGNAHSAADVPTRAVKGGGDFKTIPPVFGTMGNVHVFGGTNVSTSVNPTQII